MRMYLHPEIFENTRQLNGLEALAQFYTSQLLNVKIEKR
jgi:hypothetical protein